MSTQTSARALMMRHNQKIRNREQSMLSRAVSQIGIDIDVSKYHNHIQGKTPSNFRATYDRSSAAMS